MRFFYRITSESKLPILFDISFEIPSLFLLTKTELVHEKNTRCIFAFFIEFTHILFLSLSRLLFAFVDTEVHIRVVLPWYVTRAALWRGHEERGRKRVVTNRWKSRVRGRPLGRRERAAELGMKIADQTPTFVALVQYGIVHHCLTICSYYWSQKRHEVLRKIRTQFLLSIHIFIYITY